MENENKAIKLGKAQFGTFPSYIIGSNPWSPQDVDKLEFSPIGDENTIFQNTIKAARFFYKKDPLASSIINKLVDIGITEIIFTKGTLSANEIKIFYGMRDLMQEMAENLALEYLISGLVVPEISYGRVNKAFLQELGIKKYETLILPTSMWIRDPASIKIRTAGGLNEPSYFVKIPEELIKFIQNKGDYGNGEKDLELYQKILTEYPELVSAIKDGKKEMLLENDLIFRRRYLSDSPYPVPYLSPAIELLKHKRNLRRMDYSIAARVISAIQLFKLGNDTYPILEDDQDQFTAIKDQMTWRDSYGRDFDRIYQLFANHTLEISWIFPPIEALLNDAKYTNVNLDIFYALGFPKILVIGESERSNAGTQEYTSLSPVKTMEAMRRKILRVLQDISNKIADGNSLKYTPTVGFKPLRLENFAAFSQALDKLYTSGNLSRTEYAEFFGYDWEDEVKTKSEENKTLADLKVETFAPQPFSPQPGGNQQNQGNQSQNQGNQNQGNNQQNNQGNQKGQ